MIAICVGHSRMGDMGAVSTGGVSEWHYNCDIAKRVVARLRDLGHEACAISRYPKPGYGAAMTWLAADLRKRGATCVVELHFNDSDDPASHGHEWLHWHTSVAGRALAQALQSSMSAAYPEIRSRGLVSIDNLAKRGGQFLFKTPCPAVICEPFFGSHQGEWELFNAERDGYAEVLAAGIHQWIGGRK